MMVMQNTLNKLGGKQQTKLSIYYNYDIKHFMKRAVKNSKMITILQWWNSKCIFSIA